MKRKDTLKTYRLKRDFQQTREPVGGRHHDRKKLTDPLFVIQKHAARRLHYDFRLEVDGVLKSWAVPKGPSLDPNDKRLAVPTEDHPMEYAGFEGVIPEGQYGAGRVIVWDLGTFHNLSLDNGKIMTVQRALEKGHVIVWLEGKKLRGAYSLNRMGPPGEKTPWLLIKMKDGLAEKKQPVKTRPESVLTGKTLEEIS